MPTIRSRKRSPNIRRRVGPRVVSRDRRSRPRLRDLCDEVLASYRVAAETDFFTDADRLEARAVLAKVIPLPAS